MDKGKKYADGVYGKYEPGEFIDGDTEMNPSVPTQLDRIEELLGKIAAKVGVADE